MLLKSYAETHWENNMLLSIRHMFGIKKSREDLIRQEIRATSDMFSQDSPDRKYDFFYYGEVADNTHEWIFHDWRKNGKEWSVLTTRYLVQPDAIYRTQNNKPYRPVPQEEAKRLLDAMRVYYNKVKTTVYS